MTACVDVRTGAANRELNDIDAAVGKEQSRFLLSRLIIKPGIRYLRSNMLAYRSSLFPLLCFIRQNHF
jgi:hypothetical protein